MTTYLLKYKACDLRMTPVDRLRSMQYIADENMLKLTIWRVATKKLDTMQIPSITLTTVNRSGRLSTLDFGMWQLRQFIPDTRRTFSVSPDVVWSAYASMRDNKALMSAVPAAPPKLRWNRRDNVWETSAIEAE